MEASNQSNWNCSQQEIKQYQSCPTTQFIGSHIAGLNSCVYCAQIYRRYHKIVPSDNLKTGQTFNAAEEEDQEQEQNNEKGSKSLVSNLRMDGDDDDGVTCNKLMCIRAGWCMCQ